MSQQSSDESMLSNQIDDCMQDCLNSHAVYLDTAMSVIHLLLHRSPRTRREIPWLLVNNSQVN